MEDQGILLVDGWQVDADSHRISRNGVEKKLEPRSMELLVYLAHRFEQVIPREEIEANVWHGRVVGYEALSGAIAKLRKAFDDTNKVHRVIETIPKSGYRLIAPVSRKNPTGEPATESVDAPAAKTKNWMSMVGATVLVVVVFGLAWWQPWITHEEPASVERMAFSLPDKPSIAILPFTNMSDDPEQRYFADGMTDDLITDLSKISGLFVISRNSAFTYKDKPVKIRQVAEDLGVRYVMEGSVRRAGDQVRINAQLIDATTGGHLWAERYDGNISDIFVLQDQVVQKIVVSLAVNLTLEEQERQATNQETGSMRAYDEYLKGWQSYLLTTEEGHDKAAKHLEQAINLDPTYSRAHAMLATVYYQNSVYGWSSDGEKSKRQLELALKKPTPLAHRLASTFLANEERWDEAIDEAARGIILDPNDPEGYAAMGKVLDRSGEPVKAMEFYDKALRLDPTFPSADLLCYTGYNQFQLGRYEDSAVTLERSVTRSPGYHASYPVLAAAYGYLGRDREARDVIEAYNNIRGFQVNMTWLTNRTFSTPEPRERMREGLRKAGILE